MENMQEMLMLDLAQVDLIGLASLSLRSRLRRTLIEWRNIGAMIRGRPDNFWNDSYGSGFWNFLEGRSQRPRHYAIAGLIKDLALPEPSILEIGCGYASLLTLLEPNTYHYEGTDFSSEVVEQNQKRFSGEHIRFSRRDVSVDLPPGKFDFIVASEVLYYFHLREIENLATRLLDRLNPGGVLIVTMNKNPKAIFIWIALNRLARCTERLSVMNAAGSRWSVRTFQKLKNEPKSSEDIR